MLGAQNTVTIFIPRMEGAPPMRLATNPYKVFKFCANQY